MDLQDFSGDMLYFDEASLPRVNALLQEAAARYGAGNAERPLLEAFRLAPEDLSVLVGLYRFYYYQHRYLDAVSVARHAMRVVAPRIDFPEDWQDIGFSDLAGGVMKSIGLVRFYLLALKGSGYLNLRLARFEEGLAMLRKVVELDEADRLGARLLLDVLADHTAEVVSFPVNQKLEVRP